MKHKQTAPRQHKPNRNGDMINWVVPEYERLRIRLEGTTGLIVDHYSGNGKEDANDPRPAEVQAAARLWVSMKDQTTPVVPGPPLWRCFIDAGRYHHREGSRGNWSALETSHLPGVVDWNVDEVRIETPPGLTPWVPNVGGIVTAGGRRHIFRPIFPAWALEFEFGIDVRKIPLQTVYDIWVSAGQRVGLGVMRPSRRYFNGKFRIVKFETVQA